MQTLTLSSGQKLRYLLNLDEFPAERRSFFTRYQLEAAEFDMTPEGISNRIIGLMQLNVEGKREELAVGLENMMFSLNAIRETYSADMLSFGAIVFDVDGKEITDFSPDGLRDVIAPLQIPLTTMQQVVDEVKKNSAPTESVISLGVSLGMFK